MLTRYFNKSGIAYPSRTKLGSDLGLEKKMLQRIFKSLAKFGYLEIETGKGHRNSSQGNDSRDGQRPGLRERGAPAVKCGPRTGHAPLQSVTGTC